MTLIASPAQPASKSNLIGLLWTFRERLAAKPHQVDTDFERLLSEPDYRNGLFDRARAMEDPGIQNLAQRLARTEMPESLLEEARQQGLLPKAFQPVLARPWRRLLLALLALALIATGVYSQWERLLETLTGTVVVATDIDTDTRWRADRTYRLDSDIFVHNDAILSIAPGTVIKGRPGSSLVIARGSQLVAEGTRSAPIVFTSAEPVGQRERGDWGGVVLLGDDRTNEAFARVEGVDVRDIRGHFGGQERNGSCGSLRYVRIEYAGYEAFVDNELNGLTVAGCGPQTTLEYLQIHKALDDGIEFFGGSANVRHLLITGARDDSLDWDLGWNGKVQFLIAQQHPNVGDRAFEGDNSPERDNARPRSEPQISNITLVGTAPDHTAMVLRSGTAGQFSRILLSGYGNNPIDLRDPLTESLVRQEALRFTHLAIDGESAATSPWRPETGDRDNDAGFAEPDYFNPISQGIPGLLGNQASNPVAPDFRPRQPTGSSTDWPDNDPFWDRTATYAGAVNPAATTPWYLGWTDFSEH